MLSAAVFLAPVPLGFLGYACGRRVRGPLAALAASCAVAAATLAPAAWVSASGQNDPDAFYALTSLVVLTVPALLGFGVGLVSAKDDAAGAETVPEPPPRERPPRPPATRHERAGSPPPVAPGPRQPPRTRVPAAVAWREPPSP